MNERRRRFRQLLAERPRTLREFAALTIGTVAMAPSRALLTLEGMEACGLVHQSLNAEFTLTEHGRHALELAEAKDSPAAPPGLTPSPTFRNTSMAGGSYREPRSYVRDTGNSSIPSRGI